MNIKKEQQQYTIWIEAEQWIPGAWNTEDANTDVIVTWEDGNRWVANLLHGPFISERSNLIRKE